MLIYVDTKSLQVVSVSYIQGQYLHCAYLVYTILTACVWKNGCKPVGSKWFDKESCRGYSCVLDITDNDVKITERTVGKSSVTIKQTFPAKLGRQKLSYIIKKNL